MHIMLNYSMSTPYFNVQADAANLLLIIRATVAVLYRPYVFNEPTFQVQSSWTNMALEQARAAASNTNKILEKIIELDAIQLLKPMMCDCRPCSFPLSLC